MEEPVNIDEEAAPTDVPSLEMQRGRAAVGERHRLAPFDALQLEGLHPELGGLRLEQLLKVRSQRGVGTVGVDSSRFLQSDLDFPNFQPERPQLLQHVCVRGRLCVSVLRRGARRGHGNKAYRGGDQASQLHEETGTVAPPEASDGRRTVPRA